MTNKIVVFWFRRDLRLEDNHGLYRALQSGFQVLPLFIFDKNILSNLQANDPRASFIHSQLTGIHQELQKHGAGLNVFYGSPEEIFEELTGRYAIEAVFANADYEPYANQRDTKVASVLTRHQIDFRTFKDQVIFEKNEIVKQDGMPYVVYTPYMKAWKATFERNAHSSSFSFNINSESFVPNSSSSILPLSEIGFTPSQIKIPAYNLSKNLLLNYESKRDFPAVEGTSYLGIYLRFGVVSIRQMVREAMSVQNPTFLNELIWREFFMQILWHYPQTVHRAFKPAYDRIIWRNNEEEFEKWKKGETGYPLVDAGMRQLAATGWMHNRVRMVVGSFLCKHLLIDWRWGEAWFAEKLLDYEMSSNVGNWQWVAGCGVDAAPYFRIFNPESQLKKFDPQGNYVKRWVEEIDSLYYPQPVVDHREARERCLAAYKTALE